MSYKGPIAGTFDDSAETLKIENTTDTLNPKADMHAVDEFFDETSKERFPVMLSVQTVDNYGCTPSGQTEEAFYVIVCMKEWCDIHLFHYVSSHKILKQHIYISTGATSNTMEPYMGGAMQRNQKRLDQHRHPLEQKFCQRRDVFITIQAKSGDIHVIYLTKDRELHSNMFHSKWKMKMKTHDIRSRVKDTLDVYTVMCS